MSRAASFIDSTSRPTLLIHTIEPPNSLSDYDEPKFALFYFHLLCPSVLLRFLSSLPQGLVGEKYGSIRVPGEVESAEFEMILDAAVEAGLDTHILEEWYCRDENSVPPAYYLKPKAQMLKNYQNSVSPAELISITSCFIKWTSLSYLCLFHPSFSDLNKGNMLNFLFAGSLETVSFAVKIHLKFPPLSVVSSIALTFNMTFSSKS